MPARFLINGRPTVEWTQSDMARVRLARRDPACEAMLLSPDDAIRRAIQRIRQFYIVFGGALALVFLILVMVGLGQPSASSACMWLAVAALIVACPSPFLYPCQIAKARLRIAQSPLPGPAGSTMRGDERRLAIEGQGTLPWASLTVDTADMLRIPVRAGESYFLVKSLLLAAAGRSGMILLERTFMDNVFQRLQAANRV